MFYVSLFLLTFFLSGIGLLYVVFSEVKAGVDAETAAKKLLEEKARADSQVERQKLAEAIGKEVKEQMNQASHQVTQNVTAGQE